MTGEEDRNRYDLDASAHGKAPVTEFDQYADGYCGGIDNPLKQLAGKGPEQFIEVKAELLLSDLKLRPLAGLSNTQHQPATSLLDFGCGTGIMMAALVRLGFKGELSGSDTSREMLEQARKRWESGALPKLYLVEGDRVSVPDGAYDVVVVSSVLHHVAPERRQRLYGELLRLLRQGGRMYIFEHNPYNPVTRYIVKHTPIDRNAILLRPREVIKGLRRFGVVNVRDAVVDVFPATVPNIRRAERFLRWIPLGGQYVVCAEKPITARGSAGSGTAGTVIEEK